jgi:hypothetical protein
LTATQCLQQDTRLGGKLNFNGQDIEIFINDRLLAANTAATREALRPEFQKFAERLFGESKYSLCFGSESSSAETADPRRLLTVFLHAANPFTIEDLMDNLKSGLPQVEVRANG